MASDAARKADTYHKIQLGGLIIKSGMAGQPPAVILGSLIEALLQMQPDRSHPARYKVLGDASCARGQGKDEGR
jgi:Conjugal transfer protein TraD